MAPEVNLLDVPTVEPLAPLVPGQIDVDLFVTGNGGMEDEPVSVPVLEPVIVEVPLADEADPERVALPVGPAVKDELEDP